MLKSMTGFGRAEVSESNVTFTTEIRSVNNRYCEVSLKMPQSLQNLENEIRELIQKRVSRGKLHVFIRMDEGVEAVTRIHFDREAALTYYRMLEELRYSLSIDEPINMDHILSNDSVFKIPDDHIDRIEKMRPILIDCVDKAIEDLKKMRAQEGNHLKKDFMERLDAIDQVCETIKNLCTERVPDARKKLNERIETLLETDNFDRERLEIEIALLADKLDVTEELVRLESHTKFFREALNDGESVGRKLNFLIQEMHREINTIGSKANHAGIAHHVVDLKESLEIIREQIQNIE
jgi:uncharacterized protein (TIGR00255 family)